jgi:uncharacterized protein (DUF697 family)
MPLAKTAQEIEPALPVLWLLGKTGAGKTSVLRALTGSGAVGDGVSPGTRAALTVDFPPEAPAVRFLDTRGLAEAGHDAAADLAQAEEAAHAVLAVMRLDDPVQTPVIATLKSTRLPVLLVYTGADLVPNLMDQERARARIWAQIGRDLPFVTLALPEDGLVTGLEGLLDALDSFMPRAAAILRRADEARIFAKNKATVLRYAGMAGASDVIPFAGAVTVPTAQGAMMQALAKRYGVELTPARLGVLASALGTGALVRMAAGHVLRQGAKLVPVAGQTLGAAAAAGTSFATTYALGRAASAWLYGVSRGAPADPARLRALYDQALKGARRDGAG